MTVEEFESLGVGDILRGNLSGDTYRVIEVIEPGEYCILCLNQVEPSAIACMPSNYTLLKSVSRPDTINPKSGFTRTGRLAP